MSLAPATRLMREAARQHGLFTRSQAAAAAVDLRALRGRGLVVRLTPRLYRVAGTPETWEQRVLSGCLAAGDGRLAAASHGTAARLFDLLPNPGRSAEVPVEISVRRACHSGESTLPHTVIHRVAVLEARDIAVVRRIPVTRPARTLMDCARFMAHVELECLVDETLCRRLTTAPRVERELALARRRRGRTRRSERALQRAITPWLTGPEPGSVPEMRLFRILALAGPPDPVRQHVVHSTSGRFVGRVDLAYPSAKVAIEYDGSRHHGPRQWARDDLRHGGLTAAGWLVLSAWADDLSETGAARLAADVLRRVRERSPH